MKITVITPSFNQVNYIEQTIDSVLSQNYPDLEYIVMDGGSTDGSVEIIKKYSKRLTFWTSEKDGGQSHAINKGLRMATGEVVNWLNSDDYYEPRALATVANAFRQADTLVFCARSNLVQGGKIVQLSAGTDVYKNNLEKTLGWARIDQPETFVRRRLYQSVGLLREDLHFVMDKEWWIRFLLQFGLSGIKKSDDVIANFRWQPESKTVTQKERFELETNRLFLSLAKLSGCQTEAAAMSALLPGTKDPIDIDYPIKNVNLRSVFHYFLLQRGNAAYQALALRHASQILSAIEPELLTGEDRALWRKLRFRSRFPAWIIKSFRK